MGEKNSENIPDSQLKNAAIIESIQEDAKLFSNSLQELARFCTVNVEAIITKTLIDLFGRIVERTPVDTGRAKANWFMGPSPEVEEFNEDNAGEYEYKFEDGTTVWIFNNLVYIIP
ncbi:MAG: hypothetical protein KAS39_08485, partial [Actinomycetia bacterium]|nr:hypothetical protein [Actinomycetes bacterium]